MVWCYFAVFVWELLSHPSGALCPERTISLFIGKVCPLLALWDEMESHFNKLIVTCVSGVTCVGNFALFGKIVQIALDAELYGLFVGLLGVMAFICGEFVDFGFLLLGRIWPEFFWLIEKYSCKLYSKTITTKFLIEHSKRTKNHSKLYWETNSI